MVKETAFIKALAKLEALAVTQRAITVEQMIKLLEGKGVPALIIAVTLPCAFPVQIPGLSAICGALLALLSLRLIFGNVSYCPSWIGKKTISSRRIIAITKTSIKWMGFLQRLVKPRLPSIFFPWIGRVAGIFLLLFAICLSLPIPFTNLLFSLPILFISLGLLEEDGLFLLLGFLISIFILTFSFKLIEISIINTLNIIS